MEDHELKRDAYFSGQKGEKIVMHQTWGEQQAYEDGLKERKEAEAYNSSIEDIGVKNYQTNNNSQTASDAFSKLIHSLIDVSFMLGIRNKKGYFASTVLIVEYIFLIVIILNNIFHSILSCLIFGLFLGIIPLVMQKNKLIRRISQYLFPILWIIVPITTKGLFGSGFSKILVMIIIALISYGLHYLLELGFTEKK